MKVAILVDLMGSGAQSAEDEVKEHKKKFRQLLKPAKSQFYQIYSFYADNIQPGTNLVLFDFGGMMPGSDDLVTSNCREVIKWAQDNPSSLVMVMSSFTYSRYLKLEMEDLGLRELPNIVSYYDNLDDPFPQWFHDLYGPRSTVSPDKKIGLLQRPACFRNKS